MPNSLEEDSDHMPIDRRAGFSDVDFIRLERKVDRMAESLNNLIRVEERQKSESSRINDLETKVAVSETRISGIDRKVDQWVNRGIGVWAVAAFLFAAYFKFKGL